MERHTLGQFASLYSCLAVRRTSGRDSDSAQYSGLFWRFSPRQASCGLGLEPEFGGSVAGAGNFLLRDLVDPSLVGGAPLGTFRADACPETALRSAHGMEHVDCKMSGYSAAVLLTSPALVSIVTHIVTASVPAGVVNAAPALYKRGVHFAAPAAASS